MGLVAFSTILSIILGSCVWLLLGDRFPLGQDTKWPTVNNICCYAALLAVPIYLLIFFVF